MEHIYCSANILNLTCILSVKFVPLLARGQQQLSIFNHQVLSSIWRCFLRYLFAASILYHLERLRGYQDLKMLVQDKALKHSVHLSKMLHITICRTFHIHFNHNLPHP
jgi:hypothetical protein